MAELVVYLGVSIPICKRLLLGLYRGDIKTIGSCIGVIWALCEGFIWEFP